jgi:hypothetical protein
MKVGGGGRYEREEKKRKARWAASLEAVSGKCSVMMRRRRDNFSRPAMVAMVLARDECSEEVWRKRREGVGEWGEWESRGRCGGWLDVRPSTCTSLLQSGEQMTRQTTDVICMCVM